MVGLLLSPVRLSWTEICASNARRTVGQRGGHGLTLLRRDIRIRAADDLTEYAEDVRRGAVVERHRVVIAALDGIDCGKQPFG